MSGAVLAEWGVYLARQRPRAVLPLLLIIAGASALATAAFAHPLPALLAAGALFASVSEFLLPITYRVTAEGIARRNGLSYSSILWKDVRRIYYTPEGIKLSPLSRPSPLEAFRGVTLHLPADASVRARLDDAFRVYCPHVDPEARGSESDAIR